MASMFYLLQTDGVSLWGRLKVKGRHADLQDNKEAPPSGGAVVRPKHSPQEVLMASRSSAYFHLLSSYFLALAAALEAWTCGPLRQEADQSTQEVSLKVRQR